MEEQRHPSPESDSSKKTSSTFSQKLAKRLGSKKNYNLWLFLLTASPMLTFTLLGLPYLRLDAILPRSISPSDWFYRTGWYRWAITIHLFAILPVGVLMIPQSIPHLRSKKHIEIYSIKALLGI
ncbi:MAG: hypothetical protein L6R42_007213, partial [Xanthoria sp. 1 TBL-2021]